MLWWCVCCLDWMPYIYLNSLSSFPLLPAHREICLHDRLMPEVCHVKGLSVVISWIFAWSCQCVDATSIILILLQFPLNVGGILRRHKMQVEYLWYVRIYNNTSFTRFSQDNHPASTGDNGVPNVAMKFNLHKDMQAQMILALGTTTTPMLTPTLFKQWKLQYMHTILK